MMMRKIAALLCCVVTLSAHAELTQSRAHGFHWYSSAPKEKVIKPTVPVNVAPTQARTPYEELMEMKRQTLNTLSQALITPSYETTYDYMKIQQTYAKRNQAFVRYWQQVLMTHPELDHTLIFPTDNSAIAIRNDETSALMERVIHEGSKKYGLILFYQGKSSVSQKMAAHLAPFANASHFSMISVTTDGQPIEGLPNPKNIPLSVVQRKMDMQARYMPALFLVNLETEQMSPLSYGFVSTTELKERLLDVATNYKRFSYEGLGA